MSHLLFGGLLRLVTVNCRSVRASSGIVLSSGLWLYLWQLLVLQRWAFGLSSDVWAHINGNAINVVHISNGRFLWQWGSTPLWARDAWYSI